MNDTNHEWSVRIEATGPGTYDAEWAGEIVESPALQGRGPVVSFSKHDVGFRFDVQALDVEAAGREALRVLREVAPDMKPYELKVQSVEELERQMAESNVPDLLGVSEVAEALGVSRQRVAELAEANDFPPPVARLKAGPIWQRSQVARFIGRWVRRPGRPRRSTPVSSSGSAADETTAR